MWNKTEHDFGEVSKGVTLVTEFIYTGNKEVLEIEPLCSCVGYTFKDNTLTLRWAVKKNPITSFSSDKIIMIVYKDKSIDDLKLLAYIKV